METEENKLPEGYRILNDGPNRKILTRDEWDQAFVFKTVKEATDYAIWLESECS